MLRLDLTEDDTRRLRRRLEQLPDPSVDLEGLLAGLVQAAALLPIDVVRTLLEIRSSSRAPGALLLTGLPIDRELPPTPADGARPPYKPGSVSERAILLCAVLLGEPVGYVAEKEGALVQDVFPTRAERTEPSNASSGVDLDFHTELTFSRDAPERPLHLAAPDFVLLLGLRSHPDRSAMTLVAETRDVLGRLQGSDVDMLREELFQLRAPHSFTRDADGSRPWSQRVALLHGGRHAPFLAFDGACGVRALSPEAGAALDALRRACADPTLQASVQLRPGDLLAIDNTRAVHARSQYEARFDGEDRWLQRAYVRRSIRDLRPVSVDTPRLLL